ncbi:MAG: hypothetical protein CMH56_13415 [Myxococcales bacterium]|nr:hypothetical protein [Myxococcales bacterium]
MTPVPSHPIALVVGSTGVAGASLVDVLAEKGWRVVALSRRSRNQSQDGVTHVAVDLLDGDALKKHLGMHHITHVFYAAQKKEGLLRTDKYVNIRKLRRQIMWVGRLLPWIKWIPGVMPLFYWFTMKEAGALDPTKSNLQMFKNVMAALEYHQAPLQHLSFITGAKSYGMHLGPQLYPNYDLPFDEDRTARVPGPNWYYEFEDHVASQDYPFSWSLFRPSFLIGAASGSPFNLGTTLAVYATIQKLKNEPLVFWGDRGAAQCDWEISPSRQLAEMMIWSADEPRAHGQAFNCTTGEPFKWIDLWPRLAAALQMPYDMTDKGFSMKQFVDENAVFWDRVTAEHGLVPHRLDALVAWEFIDKAMAIDWDVRFRMDKAENAGFKAFKSHEEVFWDVFRQLQDAQIIPNSQWVLPKG